MTDLVVWLRQQLDTDEARALAVPLAERRWAIDGGVVVDGKPHDDVVDWVYVEGGKEHIATHDPARVLRQVQAHRAILDALEAAEARQKVERRNYQRWIDGKPDKPVPDGPPEDVIAGLKLAVRTLVSIYSDRDGYDPSWSA